MMTKLLFQEDAKEKMLDGIKKLAQAVGSTLGPQGRLVAINDGDRLSITKDGYNIAKAIHFSDQAEEIGATIIREAAVSTANETGDSTTTSTILAEEMITRVSRSSFTNVREVMRGIRDAENEITTELDKRSIPLSDDDIIRVASLSANGDEKVGEIIGSIYRELGRKCIITLGESANYNTTFKPTKGMQFENGSLMSQVMTSNAKEECVLDAPYVLITDQKIKTLNPLINVLNAIARDHGSLLLIAEDFDDTVLQNLTLNHLKGVFKCCAVKAPSYGDYRKQLIKDIAVLTNGTAITYESGLQLKDVTISMLGSCKSAIISKSTTTIINDESEALLNHVAELSEKLTALKADVEKIGSFEEKFLEERVARLVGGCAEILVGGATEQERKELHDRIEDAVCATKAAVEEGVLRGGGLTFYDIFSKKIVEGEDDYALGMAIVYDAISAPQWRLIANAGKDPIEVRKELTAEKGFDGRTGEIVDMLEKGIIDPTKSMKMALKNACSVVITYLNTDTLIIPEF